MIARLFARAGVDYEQWKAITRTLLRSDFRPPTHHRADAYSLRTVRGALAMVIIYGLMGLAAALIVFINRDVLLTGTVVLSYVAMVVTTALLTQHAGSIVSTADYAILGPLPVSSRTFFTVRLTNVLFHTTLLTTLMGYPSVVAYTIAHGASVPRGIAAALALYAFCTTLTFAVIAVYATVLRLVGAARLERVLGYVQTGVGLMSYLGIFFVMQFVQRSALANAALPRGVWLFFVPPAWFASYLELASGDGSMAVWTRALVSLAALGGTVLLLRGPLAVGYAEQLGQLSTTSGRASRGEQPAPRAGLLRLRLFQSGEARAVALLVRAQFRHDLKVRLGILSIVPMTLLYMFMGARDASQDPFTLTTGRRGVDLTAMIVLFFPSVLVQQLAWSDAYRAAWVYFATPADRARLIVATKTVIVTFFILPFVLFLAVAYAWRFGHAGHAAVHAMFLGLLGHVVLQLAMLSSPRLPFATTQQKASGNMVFFATMMVTLIAGNLFLIGLQQWVYAEPYRIPVTAAALFALLLLLNPLLRARANASLRHQFPELG